MYADTYLNHKACIVTLKHRSVVMKPFRMALHLFHLLPSSLLIGEMFYKFMVLCFHAALLQCGPTFAILLRFFGGLYFDTFPLLISHKSHLTTLGHNQQKRSINSDSLAYLPESTRAPQ